MNEELLTHIPEWAVEKLPYSGNINVVPGNELEQIWKYIRNTPLYVEDDNKVLTLLDRYAVTNNADETPQNQGEEKSTLKQPNSYVRPHVAEQDNKRMEPPIFGHRTIVDDNAVRDLKSGFEVAIEQNKISWQNLINEVKKHMTTDDAKRAEIEKEQDELSRKYEALPPTRDAATLAATATNIVGVGLPMLIAGMIGPEVAAVAGGGAFAADALASYSQADMEMDAYERKTGKKLSKGQRVKYQVALTATNIIMNTMLGANMLKGMTKSMQREMSKQITKKIYDNPVAQEEFNTMTRRVLQRERDKRVEGVVQAGVESGVSSGLMEAEKVFYTEQAPELENIIASTFGGFVGGVANNGASSLVQSGRLHYDRMKNDELFYVSDVDNKVEQARPINEIIPTDVDGSKVKGEMIDLDIIGDHIEEYDSENIVRGSYRKAMKDRWVHKEFDDMLIPKERSALYQKQWNMAEEMEDKNRTYELQNVIVQRVAADMGLPIQVYARIDDLPPELAKIVREENYCGITTHNGGTAIVLEQCQKIPIESIAGIIRHEVVGHKGLRRLYNDKDEYINDLFDAGIDLLPQYMREKNIDRKSLAEKIEERGALKTENRPYSPNGTPNRSQKEYENYEKLYDMLRRSEDAARQSTTNELRKKNNSIGGNPMPQIYEFEAFDKLFEQ